MRKEVVFAVVFGIFIGLVFMFGIVRVNGAIKQRNSNPNSDTGSLTKDKRSEIKDNNISLTLLKPNNMQVFGDDVIQINGATKADSYVIVTGGSNDVIGKSNNTGSFDFEYEIDPSLNFLQVYSVSQDNSRSNTNLEVVYSSEAVKKDLYETEDLDDKIEDKLENLQNISQFYKGTITDITDTSMQMKTSIGEIKQISYSTDSTSFAKIAKTTTRITASDVAIGDYAIILGYKKNNGVLDAFRILITQPSTTQEVKIFYGSVVKKNPTDIEITETNSGNITIEIDNNSSTYTGDPVSPEKTRFANIKSGDIVIGTYVTDKEINVARRIFILNTP